MQTKIDYGQRFDCRQDVVAIAASVADFGLLVAVTPNKPTSLGLDSYPLEPGIKSFSPGLTSPSHGLSLQLRVDRPEGCSVDRCRIDGFLKCWHLTFKRWVVKITSGKVVSIEFQIADANGTILDKSDEDNEWTFLTGSGEIPEGLEGALDGKEVGDTFSVTLTPETGYGERDEALVQTIAKSDLGDEDVDLSIGDQLEAETEDGYEVVTVVAITPDSITVDGNHEFAGKTVRFDVKITEVRDATEEELQHGHVHDGECESEEWDETWTEVDEFEDGEEYDDEDFDDEEEDETESGNGNAKKS